MPLPRGQAQGFWDRSDRSVSLLAVLCFALVLFWPEMVSAADTVTLGYIICRIDQSISYFSPLFDGMAFCIAAVLAFKGIMLLKKHTDNPNDSQIVKGLAHLLGAGGLASLPTFIATIVQTLHLSSSSSGTLVCTPGAVDSASGASVPLDKMMVNFVGNIRQPMYITLSVLAFLMGVLFIIRGLLKSTKTGSDPRAAAPQSIVTHLLVGGILTTVGSMLITMTDTLFGSGINNSVTSIINWTKITGGAPIGDADTVVKSILQFVQIIGIIGFIRGWLIVKNAVEGAGQATIPQGITHIIGGTMAFNIGVMLRLFDATFGTGLINTGTTGS